MGAVVFHGQWSNNLHSTSTNVVNATVPALPESEFVVKSSWVKPNQPNEAEMLRRCHTWVNPNHPNEAITPCPGIVECVDYYRDTEGPIRRFLGSNANNYFNFNPIATGITNIASYRPRRRRNLKHHQHRYRPRHRRGYRLRYHRYQ